MGRRGGQLCGEGGPQPEDSPLSLIQSVETLDCTNVIYDASHPVWQAGAASISGIVTEGVSQESTPSWEPARAALSA